MMPVLDIVIPTYNRKKALERTLESLLPYLCCQVTVTVLDNGSSYDLGTTKRMFDSANISFVRNEYNIGPTLNYIKSLGCGNSPYVWVICDDDDCDFSGLSTLCDFLATAKVDVLMVGRSVGLRDYSSEHNGCSHYGKTICEAYFSNKDNIAFSFGFVPSLLYRRELISNAILEKLTANSNSYYPHVWLQTLIHDADFKVYEKAFIKKPNDHDEVPKLLHYQASWIKMSWEVYRASFGKFDLQRIIFPNFQRGTIRLIDGVCVNIKHEGIAKTVIKLASMTVYLRGLLKAAPLIPLILSVLLGRYLPRIRQYIWSNRRLRQMFMSKS